MEETEIGKNEMSKNKLSLGKHCHIFNNKTNTGSITVEAAFVMPIVILTIFALIYLALYLHDICRIQAVTDMILYKGGLTVKHEANVITGEVDYENINDRGIFYSLLGSTTEEEEQIRYYFGQELSKGLFLAKIKEVNIEVDKLKLTVSVEADINVSLPGIKYLFEPFSNTVIKGEFPVHNPAETIRCTEVILETGSSIKGVDELKEKIEDFIQDK